MPDEAPGGYPFIHVDGEHGLFSPESIDEMCRVADGFGLTVTARAIENPDAVPEVEGIDAWAGGPNDLAQSMGLPGQPGHPDVLAAQARVADRARAAGGRPHSGLMAAIELRHPIVDGAQRFLAANA